MLIERYVPAAARRRNRRPDPCDAADRRPESSSRCASPKNGSHVGREDDARDVARIEECRNWADKAAMMASYAKQAKDESLREFTVLIRARAIRSWAS
jgi:hypothetical protein